MRRALGRIGRGIAGLVAVVIVLVGVLLAGANTQPGLAIMARLVPRLTGGLVTIRGLSGRFPDRLKAAEVRLRDKDGVWARVDDLELDWEPLKLAQGAVAVDRLSAAQVTVLRRPLPSGASSSRRFALDIRALHVHRLNLAPPVTGTAASLALGVGGAGGSGGNAYAIAGATATAGIGAAGGQGPAGNGTSGSNGTDETL